MANTYIRNAENHKPEIREFIYDKVLSDRLSTLAYKTLEPSYLSNVVGVR